ncbi:MAG: hypothetical protein ACRYG5_17340 [Janthinobacterium lividum]
MQISSAFIPLSAANINSRIANGRSTSGHASLNDLCNLTLTNPESSGSANLVLGGEMSLAPRAEGGSKQRVDEPAFLICLSKPQDCVVLLRDRHSGMSALACIDRPERELLKPGFTPLLQAFNDEQRAGAALSELEVIVFHYPRNARSVDTSAVVGAVLQDMLGGAARLESHTLDPWEQATGACVLADLRNGEIRRFEYDAVALQLVRATLIGRARFESQGASSADFPRFDKRLLTHEARAQPQLARGESRAAHDKGRHQVGFKDIPPAGAQAFDDHPGGFALLDWR